MCVYLLFFVLFLERVEKGKNDAKQLKYRLLSSEVYPQFSFCFYFTYFLAGFQEKTL